MRKKLQGTGLTNTTDTISDMKIKKVRNRFSFDLTLIKSRELKWGRNTYPKFVSDGLQYKFRKTFPCGMVRSKRLMAYHSY